MEEKVKRVDSGVDENREIALGICFGSGLGIIVGTVFNYAMLGLSAGGVMGVLIGIVVKEMKRHKRVN